MTNSLITVEKAVELTGAGMPNVSKDSLVCVDGLLEFAVSSIREGRDIDTVFYSLWDSGFRSVASRLEELEG